MPWEPFHLTREQIYEAVWAAPMRDACKQFGISDVALAKTCRKFGIPRPKQGYWLRRSIGQSPARIQLPPPESGKPTEYVGQRWRQSGADAAGGDSNDADANRIAKDSHATAEELIQVPATLDDPHLLVAQTLKARRRPPPRLGLGFEQRERRLDLDVSDAVLERTLRILDGLLRAFESKGMRVHVGNDAPPGEKSPPRPGWLSPNATHVQVDGVWIGLQVFEHYNVQQVLPDPPKGMTGVRLKDFLATRRPARTNVPNGRLAIRITHRWAYGWRSICEDGKRKRIEDALGRFLPELRAAAASVKRDDAEDERRKKEELEAEKRRWEEAERRREEEERVAKLRATLDEWREVRDVRAFIDEARAIVAASGLVIREESRLAGFIRWASARADRMDPLRLLRREAREQGKPAGAEP